ncbi:hypothetical protein FA95DRAFT_1164135 [Auriscalpium vulgare]|uniref:Uncharacterized protein n=1 Tax=Auriscalpium vulgare TaxID=40419 RepID=A0ACB8S9J8_9AGAM|nr:hypothetical protein FA95DRAFT_1164135 [Auriscalpium vulgare]
MYAQAYASTLPQTLVYTVRMRLGWCGGRPSAGCGREAAADQRNAADAGKGDAPGVVKCAVMPKSSSSSSRATWRRQMRLDYSKRPFTRLWPAIPSHSLGPHDVLPAHMHTTAIRARAAMVPNGWPMSFAPRQSQFRDVTVALRGRTHTYSEPRCRRPAVQVGCSYHAPAPIVVFASYIRAVVNYLSPARFDGEDDRSWTSYGQPGHRLTPKHECLVAFCRRPHGRGTSSPSMYSPRMPDSSIPTPPASRSRLTLHSIVAMSQISGRVC